MKYNINIEIDFNEKINKDEKLNQLIEELSILYLKETFKGNKVSYYYEDINSSTKLSFNKDICFYAASSIKMLVCLMLFEMAESKKINLEEKVLVSMNDLKQGTGNIKFQNKDTEYSVIELIKLCLIESDNTAYIKLVNIIGKENIAQYGKSIGAKHTMQGKETDSFGIINCEDMILYWRKIKSYIDKKSKYSIMFKDFLSSPTTKLIDCNLLGNNQFLRKYGAFDIAYHEAGYVLEDNPYYIIILTQLNKVEYKKEFFDETIKKINKIHKLIKEK